jgi:hypothetical protein
VKAVGVLFREDFVGIGFIIASFGRSGSMTLTISLLEIKEISVFHIPRFITQGRIQALNMSSSLIEAASSRKFSEQYSC